MAAFSLFHVQSVRSKKVFHQSVSALVESTSEAS